MMKATVKVITVLMSVALLFAMSGTASAENRLSGMRRIYEEPIYESFTYTYLNGTVRAIKSPVPYRAAQVVSSASLGMELKEPVDIFRHGETIYIVDKSTDSVILTDTEFRVMDVIREFAHNGAAETFKNPEGVYVTGGKIYVADTGNKRIVVLNRGDKSVSSIITAPQSDIMSDNLVFEPQKVAADAKGRVYAVVKGVYEGIMELYEDGSFGGFIGSIPVQPDPLTVLWKSFMSKEQRAKLENFIPVEYTNLTLDDDGFLYTVSLAAEGVSSIRRLNSAGTDILMRESLHDIPVSGVVIDGQISARTPPSNFVDIAVDADGLFYGLDREYGRVFIYDTQGNMLFVFGGKNTGQNGTFSTASAITLIGSSICVADGGASAITVFERTDYAASVLNSMALYREDRYADSIASWNNVLRYNSNFVLAYSKIGQAYYQMDKNREAMAYFKKAGDRSGYSKAFERSRSDIFTDYFALLLGGLIAFAVLMVLFSKWLRRRMKKHPPKPGGAADSLYYAFYVIFHPFDGFWDLKNEKRGRARVSALIMLMTIVSFAMERGLTGFSLISDPGNRLDILYELKFVLIPIALFLVANMSITSLMDGKGTFKQIYIATGYALAPLALIRIPLTLVSNVLTMNEAVYVSMFQTLSIVWVAFLLFGALLSTHEYTAGKTVGTVALTGVAMIIICFICVLFFSLFSELVGFVYTILEEMRYR